MSEATELFQCWNDFCDADAVPEGFIERMDKAGLVDLIPVTKHALQEPFAAERGIEPSGTMWRLTHAGRKAWVAQS